MPGYRNNTANNDNDIDLGGQVIQYAISNCILRVSALLLDNYNNI